MKMAGRQLMQVLLVALSGVPIVDSWFFGTPDVVNAARDKPVDKKCEAYGEAGKCEFYACFEERFPCGSSGYMAKYGTPFCDRFERIYPAFTSKGQEFVNKTGRCLTKGLLPYYRQNSVDCHRLSHAAFDLISSCYAANGFCAVAEDNAAVFADVFQTKYLFQSGALKIWKEIAELMYQCHPDKVHGFLSSVVNLLAGFAKLLTSSGSP